MHFTVIIATRGRPEVLSSTLSALGCQTRPAEKVVVSASSPDDIGQLPRGTDCILGSPGLAAQRNRALEAVLGNTDVIVFIDDDFVPAPDWLAEMEQVFAGHPKVGGASGVLLADGAKGRGLSHADADELLSGHALGAATARRRLDDCASLYGCNMAYRATSIAGEKFDERLPLYGWLEDLDFSRRIGRRNRLVRVSGAVGVHLGVRGSRVSGVKLGYSQVVNPFYLLSRGVLAASDVIRLVMKPLIRNFVGAILIQRDVDRLGRLRGNVLGLKAVISGRLSPEKVLELK